MRLHYLQHNLFENPGFIHGMGVRAKRIKFFPGALRFVLQSIKNTVQ